MSKECSQARGLLSEYVDGSLSADSAWQVRMHLTVCADCAEALQQLRATVALVRGLSRVQVSADFDAKLAAKMSGLMPRHPSRSTTVDNLKRALRIAAIRWQDGPRLLIAGAGAAMACAVVALAMLSPNFVGTASRVQTYRSQSPIASFASVPSADLAFVAACSNQHAQYESNQSIADPTADIVAARVDEAGAASTGAAAADSGNLAYSTDTE
jgi:anti-sigma factor RsiW